MREKAGLPNPDLMSRFEREALARGIEFVAGVDEAGRGPLAGPVVAGAVIFRHGEYPCGVKDSKQLTHKRREELLYFELLREQCKGLLRALRWSLVWCLLTG
jgi:ribonuclease HIII